jgi:hypothetical protein
MNASEAIGTKEIRIYSEHPELVWSGYLNLLVDHCDRTLLYYQPGAGLGWDYVSAYSKWNIEDKYKGVWL